MLELATIQYVNLNVQPEVQTGTDSTRYVRRNPTPLFHACYVVITYANNHLLKRVFQDGWHFLKHLSPKILVATFNFRGC